MSKNHRSINQRLAKSKSAEARREALLVWAYIWSADEKKTIEALKEALRLEDYKAAGNAAYQLGAIAEKRFPALIKVIERVTPGVSLSLAELRKWRGITQEVLAENTGMSQETVILTENNDDVYLSTLRQYVDGIGGNLRITTEFPADNIEIKLPRDGSQDSETD